MGYYNWTEIIPEKSDSELKAIIRERTLTVDAIRIAEDELERRRNPKFRKRQEDLNSLYEDWLIRPGVVFEGICTDCKDDSFFLLTKEKGPIMQMSMFFANIMGITILFTGRELLTSLGLRKNRDGRIGTCIKCGTIMIQCKKCKNIQKLQGEYQICKNCNERIDKPENFHNPRV